MNGLPPQGPQFVTSDEDIVMDANSEPLFRGPHEHALRWVRKYSGRASWRVYIGSTRHIVTASEYLQI